MKLESTHLGEDGWLESAFDPSFKRGHKVGVCSIAQPYFAESVSAMLVDELVDDLRYMMECRLPIICVPGEL